MKEKELKKQTNKNKEKLVDMKMLYDRQQNDWFGRLIINN